MREDRRSSSPCRWRSSGSTGAGRPGPGTTSSPELILRACRPSASSTRWRARDFPLELADYLRANEIEVQAQGELFDLRRRVKTPPELDGIRKAQRACERAMDAIRARLRKGAPSPLRTCAPRRTGCSANRAS